VGSSGRLQMAQIGTKSALAGYAGGKTPGGPCLDGTSSRRAWNGYRGHPEGRQNPQVMGHSGLGEYSNCTQRKWSGSVVWNDAHNSTWVLINPIAFLCPYSPIPVVLGPSKIQIPGHCQASPRQAKLQVHPIYKAGRQPSDRPSARRQKRGEAGHFSIYPELLPPWYTSRATTYLA
jgi:hypothetical protein